VSSVVLAHLLMPADFGLVAMIIGVTAGLMIFKDLVLCDAVIQWPKLTHVQVSTLFWVNFGVSLTLALGLMVVSPLIAHFYREPRLIGIAILWSTTLVLGGSRLSTSRC
jgi:O-antigen/teichoic acid export membrane protein